ncbi:MAG: diguanylate cyclase, partial [Gammaproteobacteria bacterium]|nr:diguanylate cyclase [Gammaproteobacteria bacterium]
MLKYLFMVCALLLTAATHAEKKISYDTISFAAPHALERPISLFQDNRSQLWLLTEQGISLFNGSSFASYRSYNFQSPLITGLINESALLLATNQNIYLDVLTDPKTDYPVLWQVGTNETIEGLYQSDNQIFIQTNIAIYQAELANSDTPALTASKLKTLNKGQASLSFGPQGPIIIEKNQYNVFDLDSQQWQSFKSEQNFSQIVKVENETIGLDDSGNLYALFANNVGGVRADLLHNDVDTITVNNGTVYVQQKDQVYNLKKPTQRFQLPLGAEQVFLDKQNNLWVVSEYGLQVKWSQPINLITTNAPVSNDFALTTANYALDQTQLYQRQESGNWRLRTHLPIAKDTLVMLETDSRIWLKKQNRLVAIDKSTFVTSLNIELKPQDKVLKFSNHSLLIVSQDRFVSVNANGLQTVLKNDCAKSCLPSYNINSHTLTPHTVWLSTNRGLHKLDLQTLTFSSERQDKLNSLAPILQTLVANDEHLWLLYPNKIAYFNTTQKTSDLYYSPENRLITANFSSSGNLQVMSQLGWFEVQPPRPINTPIGQELNLHKIEVGNGNISYLAPEQVLELTQTEEELRLAFNLAKQHPQQTVYFRFKYDNENIWSETTSFAQSLTLKNLRQGHNELQLQARLEGKDWQNTRTFVYNMPYEYLQTKWVVIYGVILLCLALLIYGLERLKRFKMMFDSMKQQSFITSLLESTKDGVWVANKDREIQTVNAAYQEITGFTLDEVAGKSFHIFSDKVRNHEVESIIWQDVTKNGFWTGEVWSSHKDGKPISIDLSVTRVETSNKFGSKTDVKFVGVFSDVTIRKNSEKAMRHLATRDPLTDFANRTLFIELLERAINTANPQKPDFGVVIIDLDNFSKVNANLGPLQGDELLKLVALRLNNDLDKGVSIARLSGDEFALLIPNHLFIGEPEFYIRKIASHVQRKLVNSFMLGNTEVNITASLGVAFYPHHGISPEALMRCADTALKKVKQAGKNNYFIYESAIDNGKVELLTLESELIRAFNNDEFTVNFQPKYKIKQHTISGFEALVRWNNPSRGQVFPDQFIPLAEQNGLIRQLDTAVLKKVCQQIK